MGIFSAPYKQLRASCVYKEVEGGQMQGHEKGLDFHGGEHTVEYTEIL